MYKIRRLEGGSIQTSFTIFGINVWSCLRAKNLGWFRFFGYGFTWKHKSIPPIFSERIGKRKKIKIGNYKYGLL